MEPFIKKGSLIITFSTNDYKENDVITFTLPQSLNQRKIVTHRVVKIISTNNDNLYKTQGDANNLPDDWLIDSKNIIGKVVFKIPLLGYLTRPAASQKGRILIILILFLLIVLPERAKIKGKTNNLIPLQNLKILVLIFLTFLINDQSQAFFSDGKTLTKNSFTTRCWTPPAPPSLISPSNNQSFNHQEINFSWQPNQPTCPIADILYQFQLASNKEFNPVLETGPWSNNLNYQYSLPDEGEYWWRIKAKDQFNNLSLSNPYRLTVDSTPPSAVLYAGKTKQFLISEKIINGGFENETLYPWESTGEVITLNSQTITDSYPTDPLTVKPYQGKQMIRLGNDQSIGSYTWENRLMGSFDPGPKTISLYYNFFTRDVSFFDDPGFLIRLNGKEIFRLNTLSPNPNDEPDGSARSTGWKRFVYDLSDQTNEKINLSLLAGNTEDQFNPSWVYIDQITTNIVSATPQTSFTLEGNDPNPDGGIAFCQYSLDSTDWIKAKTFSISQPGEHLLQYRCFDQANNPSPIYSLILTIDNIRPNKITDLEAIATENMALLSWTAPGNDNQTGQAAKYDLRYQKNCFQENDFNFDTALKVDNIPPPQQPGEYEEVEILGLNPQTSYCFAVKTADQGPNWSQLSNIALVTTDIGDTANFQDIIINELMWMGTSQDSGDEWIELRNMTDRQIDLSGWYLTKLSSAMEKPMFTFPPGTKIKPYGYLVVSEYDQPHSALKNQPDIVVGNGATNDPNFSLSNTTLQISLYNNNDDLIDQAWDGSPPSQGLYDPNSNRFYSLERTAIPGDGTDPLNWYTCIDQQSSIDFFDGQGDERGTPGEKNRSENEPIKPRIDQSLSNHLKANKPTPTRLKKDKKNQPLISNLSLSEDKKSISFTVSHIESFTSLSYELRYQSENNLHGIVGQTELKNQSSFSKQNLPLATCSQNVCSYHHKVSEIKLTITLKNPNGQIIILEQRKP